MSLYMNKQGFFTGDPLKTYSTNGSHTGQRECLGFFGATGGSTTPYLHVKTNASGNAERMHKFEYDGYTYSHLNIHNSVTLYTYSPQNVPYNASLVNWGESTGGIVNYYYSSDIEEYLVIVIQTSGSYTGGFLYHQSGRSHTDFAIDILAHSSSANTSGVY